MKHLAQGFVLAGALSATLVMPAYAESPTPGPYVGVSGVASLYSDVSASNGLTGTKKVSQGAQLDNGLGVLVRGGYRFSEFRTDLELGYRNTNVDKVDTHTGVSGDIDTVSLLVNGSYDFDIGAPVVPYVSAGLGALYVRGNVKFNDDNGRPLSYRESGFAPAGQIGAGVGYELTPNMDLVGGYSLLAAPSSKGSVDQVVKIHSLQLGVNYNF